MADESFLARFGVIVKQSAPSRSNLGWWGDYNEMRDFRVDLVRRIGMLTTVINEAEAIGQSSNVDVRLRRTRLLYFLDEANKFTVILADKCIP